MKVAYYVFHMKCFFMLKETDNNFEFWYSNKSVNYSPNSWRFGDIFS